MSDTKKLKIKKGDEVIIQTGKDKGKRGQVLRLISPVRGDVRVVVAGINMITKHTRPDPRKGIQGGLVKREASIHISNIAIFDAANNKGSKVGMRLMEDGKKIRVFKKTGEAVDSV